MQDVATKPSKQESLEQFVSKPEYKRPQGQNVDKALAVSLKKSLPAVLSDCLGNIKMAASQLGVASSTVRRWCEADPELKQCLLDIKADVADEVAYNIAGTATGKLHGLPKNCLTGAIYYSKAQMGWSDRQIIEHRGLGFGPPPTEEEAVELPALLANRGGPPEGGTADDEEGPVPVEHGDTGGVSND